MPFAGTEAMNAHLAEIGRTVAPGAHAILVLDGAGWHGASGLIVPDNLSLVTLPPYAPELNPIENVWACLRGNKLAITAFDSYDAIVAKCCEACVDSQTKCDTGYVRSRHGNEIQPPRP